MPGRKLRITGIIRENRPGDISPVSYYRLGQPLAAIKALSSKIEVKTVTQFQHDAMRQIAHPDRIANFLLECDIFAVSRLYGKRMLNTFVNAIHKAGAMVAFDTDDDLTDEFREIGRGDDFITTIKKMDLITVSTPFLAKRLTTLVLKAKAELKTVRNTRLEVRKLNLLKHMVPVGIKHLEVFAVLYLHI